MKRIIVAQTAASGAIYTRQILALLLSSPDVEQIALVRSRHAREVAVHEGESLDELLKANNERIVEYAQEDMFAPIASGSARYDAMIIAPCSAGTLSRIATGISDSLITRAADVCLKERRPLVLMLRETPLSLIHLRNMVTLSEAGAIVMPASPSFYMGEATKEELCQSLSARAITLAGIDVNLPEWQGAESRK